MIMTRSKEIHEWHHMYLLGELASSSSSRVDSGKTCASTRAGVYDNIQKLSMHALEKAMQVQERLDLLVIRALRFSLGANAFT